jgi:transcriptional regulator with XRE-family HTH domain
MLKISLAAARKNANFTQEQAAKELNVAVSTIKNWEKGITTPKVPQADALCELYGVPYDCIEFGKKFTV